MYCPSSGSIPDHMVPNLRALKPQDSSSAWWKSSNILSWYQGKPFITWRQRDMCGLFNFHKMITILHKHNFYNFYLRLLTVKKWKWAYIWIWTVFNFLAWVSGENNIGFSNLVTLAYVRENCTFQGISMHNKFILSINLNKHIKLYPILKYRYSLCELPVHWT